jgi:hypothetical protein
MDEKIRLSFDDEFKIRALDASKFSKADELQRELTQFYEKINGFREKTNSLVDVLEAQAKTIDGQKLRVRSRLCI